MPQANPATSWCRCAEPALAGTAFGLGSRLIDAMVAQLGAVSAWEQARPSGTRFRMDLRL